MSSSNSGRIISLDALRGLDMLLLIGLGSVFWNLGAQHSGTEWGRTMQLQMGHATWQGLHVYDLVFPLFVYLAGVAQNFSLRKRLSLQHSRLRLLGHMWYRAVVLVLLGWIVNGPLVWNPQSMRYASVLGLIGLSGALCGSLALLLRRSAALGTAAILILGGIAAAQYWGGDFTPTGCVNARLDALLCPGKLYNVHYDPEGPLCILSATALSLLGYLSGRLFSNSLGSGKRLLALIIGGAIVLAGGLCGPVIKNIWSPCFVLAAAGIGAILLGIFHLLCDVLPHHAWCYPLQVVGSNALFIYIFTNLVNLSAITERLFAGTLRLILPQAWMGVALSSAYLLLAWLLCFFLYRRRVFIKI